MYNIPMIVENTLVLLIKHLRQKFYLCVGLLRWTVFLIALYIIVSNHKTWCLLERTSISILLVKLFKHKEGSGKGRRVSLMK